MSVTVSLNSSAYAYQEAGATLVDSASWKEAETVVASNEGRFRKVFEDMEKIFQHESNRWIEPLPWVYECIDKGRYFHKPPVFEAMKGRHSGSR